MELTKEYFDEKLSQLVTKEHFDEQSKTFAKKNDLLELSTKSEVNAVREDIAEVKTLVEELNKRDDEDTEALGRDIRELKRRVSALERR